MSRELTVRGLRKTYNCIICDKNQPGTCSLQRRWVMRNDSWWLSLNIKKTVKSMRPHRWVCIQFIIQNEAFLRVKRKNITNCAGPTDLCKPRLPWAKQRIWYPLQIRYSQGQSMGWRKREIYNLAQDKDEFLKKVIQPFNRFVLLETRQSFGKFKGATFCSKESSEVTFKFLAFFFPWPWSMWDFSLTSPARDRTGTPCSESTES